MALLSRSALLSSKLPTSDVPVPEMGQDAVVRVQQMSVNTRSAYFDRIIAHRDAERDYEFDQTLPVKDRQGLAKPAELDTSLLAIAHSIVDEDGSTMFTEQDIPLFGNWPQNAVSRIFESIEELNNYQKDPNKLIEAEKKD